MGLFRRGLSFTHLLGLEAERLDDQPLNRGAARFPIDFARIEDVLRASAERSRGWLRRLLPPVPIVFELPAGELRFSDLDEFRRALDERTVFPEHHSAGLADACPVELKRIATNLRQVEKRLADILAEALDEPGTMTPLLRQLDLKLFSKDHDWRDLMAVLARQSEALDDLKKLALVRYMHYLSSRQEVLRNLYLRKRYQREPAETAATGSNPGGLSCARNEAFQPHETAIFDQAARTAPNPAGPPLRALPRGETVCIQLRAQGETTIGLSRQHLFKLLAGNPMRLVDPRGVSYELLDGRNVVGRHAGNEVVLDPAYHAASRRHVVIEPLGPATALFTDLSAHGTLVEADRLPETARLDVSPAR